MAGKLELHLVWLKINTTGGRAICTKEKQGEENTDAMNETQLVYFHFRNRARETIEMEDILSDIRFVNSSKSINYG